MRRAGFVIACILILLGIVAAAGLVGRIIASGVALVAAAVLLLALLLPWRGWVSALALSFALLGSATGVLSVIQAFAAVGRDAEYSARAPMAIAALVLALAAGGGALVARRHLAGGAALMALAGLAGAVAINLYDINTVYDVAVPLWLVSALLFLAKGLRPDAPASE